MRILTDEEKAAVARKARAFWDADLEDIEPAGLHSDIQSFPVTLDERVPQQGSVLLDRPAYLPKSD